MPFPQNRNNEGQGGLTPPPAQPVRKFDTANIADGYYSERVDVSARDYVPLVRGTRYSTIKNALQTVIDQFPNLFFLRETLDPFFYPWALRLWATDELADATYGSTVTYLNENVDYPMYAREFCIPREVYEADPSVAVGSPLTGIIGVKVNAGGTGYTKDDQVAFASGDATARLVVGDNGEILLVTVTAVSSGYDSDSPPAVSVMSYTGSGASLSAIIQDKTAVLTSQKKVEFPDDDPNAHEKIKLLLIYETLPGPFDYSTRLDPDNVVVAIAVRRNIAANIESGEVSNSAISIKTTKKGDQNSYVADEIIETRGLPGPPIPSILINDELYGAYAGKELYYSSDITPLVTEIDGVLYTVEKKEVSDSLSEKVSTSRKWLDDADYRIEIPNVIPIEFRALIPTKTVSHKVKGFASQPSIGANEFARAEKQLDAIFKRVTVETLGDISLPISHTTTQETNELGGGILDIVRTLASGLQTAEEGFDVVFSEVHDLGNGLSFKETRTFQDFSVVPSARIGEDLKVETVETLVRVPGDITPSVSESGGILSIVEKEPITHLRSNQVSRSRQWLDDADFKIEIPNLIPTWARALIPTRTVSHKVKGTASQPTLGAGEFARAEKQLDDIFKRVTVETLNFSSLPVILTNHGLTEKFGGSATTITMTLNTLGVMGTNQGLTVLDSKVEDLGNGMAVRVTEEADVGAWYYLHGQDYDEQLDVVIPFVERTIAESAQLGTPKTDIKTEDIWRSKLRTIDSSAAETVLGAYLMQYPSKTNVSMPDKLVSLVASIESQTGDASDSEVGSVAGYGSYSINLDMRADATASATIIPEVVAEIKQFYGPNIDCTHFIFFLPNPVTSAQVLAKITALIGESISAWPKFNPQTLTLLIVGANAALKVNAASKGSYSQAADLSSQSSTAGGGTGHSRGRGLTLRRMQISPTIHDSLTVTGTTTDTVDLTAYCGAEAVGLGPYEAVTETDSITAFTSPTSFDPTDGDTDWPASGKFLYRVDGRPYKYGFVMFHCIVVDAADFPNN